MSRARGSEEEMRQSDDVPDLSSLGRERALLSPHFPTRRCFTAKFPNGLPLPNTSRAVKCARSRAVVDVVKVPELRSMMTTVMTLPTTQNESVRRAAPSYSPPFSPPSSLSLVAFISSIRIASIISHGAANFPHRAFHRSSREFAANGIHTACTAPLNAPPKFAPFI